MQNHQFLKYLVRATNEESFAVTGERATCVLTAHALNAVLQELGRRSYLLRVETTINHPTNRAFADCVLGRGPWERRATAPGMWRGHLVVAIDTAWLLDPTLDQANKPEWGRHRVGPLALRLPSSFWIDPRGHRIAVGELEVSYRPYCRPQSGFTSKGDARPSHWRPIAERVLERIHSAPYISRFLDESARCSVADPVGDDASLRGLPVRKSRVLPALNKNEQPPPPDGANHADGGIPTLRRRLRAVVIVNQPGSKTA